MGQEEKESTEDEMVGWHHCLNRHDLEQALGDSERQGGLVCCSPWGSKESNMTERLKRTEAVESSLGLKSSHNICVADSLTCIAETNIIL